MTTGVNLKNLFSIIMLNKNTHTILISVHVRFVQTTSDYLGMLFVVLLNNSVIIPKINMSIIDKIFLILLLFSFNFMYKTHVIYFKVLLFLCVKKKILNLFKNLNKGQN